jgi:hypothetical protein
MALPEPLASLSSYAAGMISSSQIQMVGINILLFCLWWALRQCRDRVKMLVVSEIWVYPIKSCAGVQLHGAALDRGGLQWDRQFAIIKPDGEVSPLYRLYTDSLHPILTDPRWTAGRCSRRSSTRSWRRSARRWPSTRRTASCPGASPSPSARY